MKNYKIILNQNKFKNVILVGIARETYWGTSQDEEIEKFETLEKCFEEAKKIKEQLGKKAQINWITEGAPEIAELMNQQ